MVWRCTENIFRLIWYPATTTPGWLVISYIYILIWRINHHLQSFEHQQTEMLLFKVGGSIQQSLREIAGCIIRYIIVWLVVWNIFSRMRSKGSRFTLGVWGLRVCLLDVAEPSATVRNRSQPSATIRNRSQPSAWLLYGRAYGRFCRRGRFWRFQTSRCYALLRFAWHAWHFVTFRRVL